MTCAAADEVYAAVAIACMKDTETVIAELKASGEPALERAAAPLAATAGPGLRSARGRAAEAGKRNRKASRRRRRTETLRAAA